MRRIWIHGVGLLLLAGLLGCSKSSSGDEAKVRVVASPDGTVEVVVEEETLFALAATGPVARTFVERPIWLYSYQWERSDEQTDRLSVQSATNEGSGARVEYANADRSRTATLSARPVDEESSVFRLEVRGAAADSIAVGIRCDEDGTFHGFGMQYNATNQRGEKLQLFVNEQGLGRDGSGGINVGNEHTTYFPMPYYLDARGFGALFETKRRVHVDLCSSDQGIAWVEVISGEAVEWRVFHGPSSLDVIRQLGERVGRPTKPPPWAYNLWLGSQGGTESVLDELDALEAADIPASALWVQDWTGIRPNHEGGFGVQYLWEPKEVCNGEADVCYPNFAQMISGLHDDGYKFLAYVNPFIVDPESVSEADDPSRFTDRFDSMDEEGLLMKRQDGTSYIDPVVANFPQSSAHPDFSKTETADYIRDSLAWIVTTYGVDGWMADFGEYTPFDAVHADGSHPEERRNTFPVDWHRVNREAFEQARPDGDWVSIARSGFTGVQNYAQIHWVGDQLTTWDELDGLPTVTPALLNLGLSGQPFVSLDIAGFSISPEPSSKEIYMRWTELGAFAPVMRTHQGADKRNNWNWNRDEETIAHFRKFTYVHCALMDEFMALAAEAEKSGAPLLRHMMLVFPDDTDAWDISDQFMIGDSLMVAPVTDQGASSRSVYFPAGTWYNVWTGAPVEGAQRATMDAPMGSPAVYSRGEDREDLRNWESLRFEDCR